jgi:hypothetical protein
MDKFHVILAPQIAANGGRLPRAARQWRAAKEHLPLEIHGLRQVHTEKYRRLVAVHPHDTGRCGLINVQYDMAPGTGYRRTQRRIALEKKSKLYSESKQTSISGGGSSLVLKKYIN